MTLAVATEPLSTLRTILNVSSFMMVS